MFKNLQIEWMKIKNYRVFQVFSVLYLLGILLVVYIFYRVYLEVIGTVAQTVSGRDTGGSDALGLFSDANLPYSVAFWTGFLLYLPGMVVINLFINEVNFKTHRQNIIDGWRRETFIYTKISLIAVMALVITIMNFFAMLIMTSVVGGSLSIDAFKVLGFCYIQAFVYLMFALFLATLFRRSGIAIIIFFIYGLLLEALLMWLFYQIDPSLRYFLPLQAADSLTPFVRMEEFNRDLPGEVVMVVAALAFAGLYVYFAVRKYKYDDL